MLLLPFPRAACETEVVKRLTNICAILELRLVGVTSVDCNEFAVKIRESAMDFEDFLIF